MIAHAQADSTTCPICRQTLLSAVSMATKTTSKTLALCGAALAQVEETTFVVLGECVKHGMVRFTVSK